MDKGKVTKANKGTRKMRVKRKEVEYTSRIVMEPVLKKEYGFAYDYYSGSAVHSYSSRQSINYSPVLSFLTSVALHTRSGI